MDDLEFVLKAIDETQQDIEALKQNLSEIKDKTEDVEDSNTSANNSFTELNSAVSLFKQGLQVAAQVYDQSIGKTLEYAEAVRSLSRTIGATPEDVSKLIQVADDVGVSQETLTAALETAIRKGVKPSIEGLGQLSEKYQAIEDPIERSKFLMDSFGRSGADMAAIMKLSKTQLDEMGKSAEAAGQVLDQRMLNQTRALEVSFDNLSDKIDGATTQISIALIPALTNASDAMAENIDAQSVWLQAIQMGAVGWEDWFHQTDAAAGSVEANREILAFYTEKIQEFIDAKQRAIARLENWRDESDRATASLWANTQATEDNTKANSDSSDALSILKLNMAGAVGKELQDFATKQTELKDKAEEYRAKIAELNDKPYLTQAQRDELAETQQGLSDVNTALDANATAHELATKRILLGILEQRLAIDGFTDEEAIFLQDTALKWGLVDKATAEASKSIIKAVADAGTSPNWEVLGKQVDLLAIKLLNLPRDINVNVRINSPAAGDVGLGGDAPVTVKPTTETLPTSGGFAEGGSFTVPGTGSGDRPFLIGLEAGERVTVTPKERSGALDDSRSVTIIQNIYTQIDYEQAAHEIADILKRG